MRLLSDLRIQEIQPTSTSLRLLRSLRSNFSGFQLLHQIFQMAVSELPKSVAPSITIAKLEGLASSGFDQQPARYHEFLWADDQLGIAVRQAGAAAFLQAGIDFFD